MALLKNRMTQTEEAEKKKKDEIKKEKTAVYNAEGKKVQEPFYKRYMGLFIAGAVIAVLACIIYVPPMFYSETEAVEGYVLESDPSAINAYQSYLKDSPEADFDGDGLTNALENEYGTDVWTADSDYDGVNDYAELFLTDTSPVESTNVFSGYVQELDQENGDMLDTPYKIDDIIFWPDAYVYKAFGSVVRTMLGYKFCDYKGWVRFPETVYAYKYADGIHSEMSYRENEDAWYIDSADEILLYSSPLAFTYRLHMPVIGTVLLPDNAFGAFLDAVFPDRGGIITCMREAEIDEQESEPVTVTASIKFPNVETDLDERLGTNNNSLQDLSRIYQLIDLDQCMAVSLYSSNAGEAIGLIYGYTSDGDLLVADRDGNPAGSLKITEETTRMVDQHGDVTVMSWYEFKGMGYDSLRYGDRISFLTTEIEQEMTFVTEDDLQFMTEPETEAAPVMEFVPETELLHIEKETENIYEEEIVEEEQDDEPIEAAGDSLATFSVN